jgi:hypothetical protein
MRLLRLFHAAQSPSRRSPRLIRRHTAALELIGHQRQM